MRKGNIILRKKPVRTVISKTYRLQSTKILIEYDITFSDAIEPKSLFFSPEINIIGVSYPYKTTGVLDTEPFDLVKLINQIKCQRIEIKDQNEHECVSIRINFSKTIDCVLFPLFSILRSEIGFEEIYQGTSIFPKIEIFGKKFKFGVEIILKTIN